MNATRYATEYRLQEYMDALYEADILENGDEIDEETLLCDFKQDLSIADSLQFSVAGERKCAPLRREKDKPCCVA